MASRYCLLQVWWSLVIFFLPCLPFSGTSSFHPNLAFSPGRSYDEFLYSSPASFEKYMGVQQYPSDEFLMAADDGSQGFYPMSSYPSDTMYENYAPLHDHPTDKFEMIMRSLTQTPSAAGYYFPKEDPGSREQSKTSKESSEEQSKESSEAKPVSRDGPYEASSREALTARKPPRKHSVGGYYTESQPSFHEERRRDDQENDAADDSRESVGYSTRTGRPYIKVRDDSYPREGYDMDYQAPEATPRKKESSLESDSREKAQENPEHAAEDRRSGNGRYQSEDIPIVEIDSLEASKRPSSAFYGMDTQMRMYEPERPATPAPPRQGPSGSTVEEEKRHDRQTSHAHQSSSKRPAPAYTPPPVSDTVTEETRTDGYANIYNEARPPPRYDLNDHVPTPNKQQHSAQEASAEEKLHLLLKQRRNPSIKKAGSHDSEASATTRPEESVALRDRGGAPQAKMFEYGVLPAKDTQMRSSTSYDNQPAATEISVGDRKMVATGHSAGGYKPRTLFHEQGFQGPYSYRFGFDTADPYNPQTRYEERDNDGHVRGSYSYLDPKGQIQVVHYEADPHSGFRVKGSFGEFPSSNKH